MRLAAMPPAVGPVLLFNENDLWLEVFRFSYARTRAGHVA